MVSSDAGLGPIGRSAAATGNIPVEAVWCGSTGSLAESVEQILGSQSLVVAQISKDYLVVSQSLRMLVVSQYDKGVEVGRMVATGGTPVVRC